MRQPLALLVFLLASAALPGTPPGSPAADRSLLLTGVRVFDPSSGTMSEPWNILVVGENIKAVGPRITERDAGAESDGEAIACTTIDCSGKYAVSGLFDCHTHLAMLTTMGEERLEKALRNFVENGVMYVRDVGGPIDVMHEMSESIAKGDLLGPELFASGPMLEKSPLTWAARNRSLPGFTVAVDSIADVDRILPDLAAKGAKIIKTFNKFDIGVYRHLVKVAEKHSLRIVHDPGGPLFHDIPMDKAIEFGVRSIEHAKAPWPVVLTENLQEEHDKLLAAGSEESRRGPFILKVAKLGLASIDTDKLEDLLDLMLENDVFFCPTLEAFHQMQQQEGAKAGVQGQIVAAMVQVGNFFTEQMAEWEVKILVGQDGFSPKGVYREMQLLADRGLSPEQILEGATLYPATWLGLQDHLGSIAPGKQADILVLERNPLEAIENITTHGLAVQRGKVVYRRTE